MVRRILIICFLSILAIGVLGSPSLAQATEPESPDSDTTIVHIQVYENGTAEWVFQTRTLLTTSEDEVSFNEFQQDYQNNSSDRLSNFESRMSRLVTDASADSARNMSVRNFSTRAFVQEVPRRWGTVEFRFLWDGFAENTDMGLEIGDVFDGGWRLSSTDSLVIHAPDEYTASESTPTPISTGNGTKLVWNGEITFASDRPEVIFVNKTEPTDSSDAVSQYGLSLELILGGLAILIGTIIGTTRFHQSRTATANNDVSSNSPSDPPMTDTEQILDLLRKNDGRMKQADINAQFEWSKSKTSLVISELADEEKISKVRLGRENLVKLIPEDD